MDNSRYKADFAARLAENERVMRIRDLERELAELRGEPYGRNRAERRAIAKSSGARRTSQPPVNVLREID